MKYVIKTHVLPLRLRNKTLLINFLSPCILLPSNVQSCNHYLKFGFDTYHFYIILYSHTRYACIPNHYIILFFIFLNLNDGIRLCIIPSFGVLVLSFIILLVQFIHDDGVPLYEIPQFVSTLSCGWTFSLFATTVSKGQDRYHSITWCKKGLIGRKVVRISSSFSEVCLSSRAFGCTVEWVSCRQSPPVGCSPS